MGKLKHNTYGKYWLSTDMEHLAYTFEYCDDMCKELFNVDIEKELFLNAFMASNIRYEIELEHPRLLSQAATDTVEMFIEVDCSGNIEQFRKITDKSYRENQMYWVGWAYAYIHYQEDLHCRDLIKILPIKDMLKYYYCGHEIDLDNFYDNIKHIIDKGRNELKIN